MEKRKVVRRRILISALVVVAAYLLYHYVIDVDRKSDPNAKTDTTAAIYTDEKFNKKLRSNEDYELLYYLYSDVPQAGCRTYVIPGLNSMKTINTYTKGVDSCEDMVPQGLAVTEQYLMITMYCYKHEHNSMLVVLDKKTSNFVKEIPLPGKPHCGGLAYDNKNKIVWVSGQANGVACANGISLAAIKEYDSEKMEAPIEYTYREALDGLIRNSFMTYKDDTLYAGYFNISDFSVVQQYPILPGGRLTDETEEVEGDESPMPTPEKFADIGARIQGMSFMDNNVLLTTSYGISRSKLMISSDRTDFDNGLNDLTDDEILAEYIMPDRMENVVYSDGKLYLLFESGAKAYRHRSFMPMDRIITINIFDDEADQLILAE